MMTGHWKIGGSMLVAALLAACSGTDGPQGPGPMLADNACAQLRSDLNAMDKRGVPGMIDARSNGKKYGPAQEAEIARYNQVLDQYLGGQCASEARYKEKAGIRSSSSSGASSGSSRRASADGVFGVTTASIPKTQVKRRKAADDESTLGSQDDEAKERAASAADASEGKTPRRKSTTPAVVTSGEGKAKPAAAKSDSAPAPAQAKAEKSESGLPSAPAPDKPETKPEAKSEAADKGD